MLLKRWGILLADICSGLENISSHVSNGICLQMPSLNLKYLNVYNMQCILHVLHEHALCHAVIFLMMNTKSEALFSTKCLVLHYFAVLLLCTCALMLQLLDVFTSG